MKGEVYWSKHSHMHLNVKLRVVLTVTNGAATCCAQSRPYDANFIRANLLTVTSDSLEASC